ncbi:MAG: PPC domain-containing protein [Deltaproteobacteria bacterium]|nr:PPC domain-containing protein [Deltaproteobacteria bacterium]
MNRYSKSICLSLGLAVLGTLAGCGGESCKDDCVLGEKMCQGNQLLTCGNFDADSCSEWGDAFTCPDECLVNQCVTSCENDCQNGARRCQGDRYQICSDVDGDTCTEWGSPQSCPPGQVCRGNGDCVEECEDHCEAGERQCVSGQPTQYQECECPATGCCDWGAPQNCAAGQSCSNGQCVTCTNDCSPAGKKECVDETHYRTCGDVDEDPCNEWSDSTECTGGQICYKGSCIAPCDDECEEMGTRVCSANGRGFLTCGDYDSDPCLEYGNTTACGANERCENGSCVFDCADECSVGQRRCLGNGYQVCGQHDQDPCTDWGEVTACKYNETCSNGFCSTVCEDECERGESECSGFQSYRNCGEFDEDPCADWGPPVDCAIWERCLDVTGDAGCHIICFNECDVLGATQCVGDGVQECGDYDWDACLEWGEVVPCGADELCSNGQCTTRPCEDDCGTAGETACYNTSGYRVCGQYDSDVCLDWSSVVPCGANRRCEGGQCVDFCTDECQAEEVGCKAGDDTVAWFCSDSDGDGCLDIVESPCPNGQICYQGACYVSCGTGADCPSGYDCQSGRCVPVQCDDDFFEDNDDAASAAVVSGDEIDLQICPRDEDWFQIHVPAGEGLRVTIYFTHADGDLDIEIFDLLNPSVVIDGSYGIDDSETVVAPAVWGEADYLVRVYGYAAAVNAYDMQVDFVTSNECMDDGFEPNDSLDEAEFVLDGVYEYLMLCEGNEDWYENYMFAGEDLIVDLLFTHANGDIDVAITDDTGATLASGVSVSDDEHVSYTVSEAGFYYVRVYLDENDYDMIIAYGAPCEDDMLEPNDSMGDAFGIQASQYSDLVLCSGNVDWYAMTVDEGGEILASIDFAHADGDLDLELYDATGLRLDGSYSSTDGETVGASGLSAGEYYLLVYGWQGAENTYDMDVVF